jgi:hypothetical protein
MNPVAKRTEAMGFSVTFVVNLTANFIGRRPWAPPAAVMLDSTKFTTKFRTKSGSEIGRNPASRSGE